MAGKSFPVKSTYTGTPRRAPLGHGWAACADGGPLHWGRRGLACQHLLPCCWQGLGLLGPGLRAGRPVLTPGALCAPGLPAWAGVLDLRPQVGRTAGRPCWVVAFELCSSPPAPTCCPELSEPWGGWRRRVPPGVRPQAVGGELELPGVICLCFTGEESEASGWPGWLRRGPRPWPACGAPWISKRTPWVGHEGGLILIP